MKLTLFPTLAVLCGLLLTAKPASAQVGTLGTVWQRQAGAPNAFWSAIASSADGTKLIASLRNGGNSTPAVYLSTNSGITWSPTGISQDIPITRSVASSANGQILAVATFYGLYVSTNSGATWDNRGGGNRWWGIACSTNGTTMVAGIIHGPLYTSTDSGTTWTARTPSSPYVWSDVASSGDGTKLVAVSGDFQNAGQMYISANSGTNWTTVAFTGQYQYWTGVASSADGTKLVAVDAYDSNANNGAYAGVIYTSSDSGLNWNASTIMSLSWASVACSYDGSKIILSSANYQGNIKIIPSWLLTSTDAGATWQPNNVPTSDNWAGVTSSADGTKLAAVNNDQNASGNIYTYALPATNTPTLNIATAGANSFLFWPWPATGYVLQQNTNLTSTNWVSLAGTPAMMNLLIAPQTNNQNFYRLVHP